MKKRLMVMLCTMMLVFGMSANVMAAVSLTGEKDETETTDKEDKAPKTGEGNAVIYAIAAALLCAGSVVVSRKRLEEAR